MPAMPLEDLGYCALSLADYARIIGYDECAFFGVFYDGQISYDCRTFWTEWQRMDIFRALQEAQLLMEGVMGYPLCRKWMTGTPDDYGNCDEQPYARQMLLRWGRFVSAGVRAETTLQAGAVINYATEPATVGPIALTSGNTSEVKVYYPGTSREISPSDITYATGNITIRIPRCRLTETPNTLDEGVDYNVLDNFLTTVDVKRVYNDPSVGAVLAAPYSQQGLCAGDGCSEYTTTGCIYPLNKTIGIVSVIPAVYSGGTWVDSSYEQCGRQFSIVRFNYLAGLLYADTVLQNAIIRLAHARMAAEPCGCKIVQALWERDRTVPQVLTRERLNCPFGVNEGAWAAYKVAQTRKLYRMRSW